MKKFEMFDKVKELIEMIDELADYGLYSYEEASEIKNKTFYNFDRVWNIGR